MNEYNRGYCDGLALLSKGRWQDIYECIMLLDSRHDDKKTTLKDVAECLRMNAFTSGLEIEEEPPEVPVQPEEPVEKPKGKKGKGK